MRIAMRFREALEPTRQLTQLAGLLDSGELTAHVGVGLALADAREAHLMLENLRPRPKGKIVLAVAA